MESNEQIYSRFLDGDESALKELMERHGSNLTLYINGYIHDLYESEDLMIESFSKMIIKKPWFETAGFKTYLYKIARNLSIRYMEKIRMTVHFNFDDLDSEPSNGQLIEDVVGMEEIRCILHASMEQLNNEYREVLYLIYFENMTYAQVSKIMKKTEKQIANLVYRGKKAMIPILKREGITDAQYR